MAVTRFVIPENISLCRERFSFVAMAILRRKTCNTYMWLERYSIPDSLISQLVRTIKQQRPQWYQIITTVVSWSYLPLYVFMFFQIEFSSSVQS